MLYFVEMWQLLGTILVKKSPQVTWNSDNPELELSGIIPLGGPMPNTRLIDTHCHLIGDPLAAIRAVRGETLHTIAQANTANACRLFGLEL